MRLPRKTGESRLFCLAKRHEHEEVLLVLFGLNPQNGHRAGRRYQDPGADKQAMAGMEREIPKQMQRLRQRKTRRSDEPVTVCRSRVSPVLSEPCQGAGLINANFDTKHVSAPFDLLRRCTFTMLGLTALLFFLLPLLLFFRRHHRLRNFKALEDSRLHTVLC